MDNFLNFLPGFNPEHEKALTHGVYNAVALGILCLVVAASYGLYIILNPFFKPLIWALLCGSALFPLKLSLTTMLQSWFATIETSNQPILVHALVLPFRVLDIASENIGALLQKWKWEHVKYVGGVLVVTLAASAGYTYMPGILSSLIWNFFAVIAVVVEFFVDISNFYVVIFLFVYLHFTVKPK